MGFWAEIKHALNSTLGTERFKPLNELFVDGKTIVPSDDVLYSIFPNEQLIGGNQSYKIHTYEFSKKIETKSSGTIRFSIDMIGGHSYQLYFNVYRNGVLYGQILTNYKNGYIPYYIDVPFSNKDVFSFSVETELVTSSPYCKFGNLKICGTVKDTSLFYVLEDNL